MTVWHQGFVTADVLGYIELNKNVANFSLATCDAKSNERRLNAMRSPPLKSAFTASMKWKGHQVAGGLC